jgi:isoamylase
MYKLKHSTKRQLSAGRNYSLGAALGNGGVNFALYSEYAEAVYLLLFDGRRSIPTDIIQCEHVTDHIWHVFVRGIGAGQLYGYKVKGIYNPYRGFRFNEHKLLIDPYAKALSGPIESQNGLLLGYQSRSSKKDLIIDGRDNTRLVPKCIVVDDDFNWESDEPPSIPMEELCIYEVHVRGFTIHGSSNVTNGGTYLGFIEKIPYLKELGVNAVELLPVHQYYSERHIKRKHLHEYWGYNSICFFAPEWSYSTKAYAGCQVTEFKTMVRELHKAGIEVLLDVVYNHTGEGDEYGPTLSFRGIDNTTYYVLKGPESAPGYQYCNDAGCGNILHCEHPQVLQLVMDSLRYWAGVMHVDGFRFDLAPLLARENGEYNKHAVFFKTIYQDPILKRVKLIAEPWDIKNYQVGNFPQGWSEWNGKFRDTVRRFWRGDKGQVKELAWRITGSADLYEKGARTPSNSINFITCHDGFTLYDLYSYNKKHNLANGENGRDGIDSNDSWNCGVEGETDNPKIKSLRKRMVKNALCSLFLSLGTPMFSGGDEFMRTQGGNNNAYCQDNDVSWFNWNMLRSNHDIFLFCKKVIAFRKHHPVLYRKRFFSGRDEDNDTIPDILWFNHNIKTPDWHNQDLRFLSYQIDGSEVPSDGGNYHLFFILNADTVDYSVSIPQYSNMYWYRVIDTYLPSGEDILLPGKEEKLVLQNTYNSHQKSVVVLLTKETG